MKINQLLVTLLSFLLIASSLYSQEKSVIYFGTNGKITTEDNAIYRQNYRTAKRTSTVVTCKQNKDKWDEIGSEVYKMMNDSTYQIKMTGKDQVGITIRTFKQQADGKWRFSNKVKGNEIRTGTAKSMIPLLLDGEVTDYYANGNIKSKSIYKDNELVSNENWLDNGDKYIDNIFYSADVEPTFKAGMKVLHQHILTGFKEASIDVSHTLGSMVVGFVVMENGTIDGIKIVKGLGPNINDIVCNSFYTLALKGGWTPAKLNGKTVRYFQEFPINFLPDLNKENVVKVRHDIMGDSGF